MEAQNQQTAVKPLSLFPIPYSLFPIPLFPCPLVPCAPKARYTRACVTFFDVLCFTRRLSIA